MSISTIILDTIKQEKIDLKTIDWEDFAGVFSGYSSILKHRRKTEEEKRKKIKYVDEYVRKKRFLQYLWYKKHRLYNSEYEIEYLVRESLGDGNLYCYYNIKF